MILAFFGLSPSHKPIIHSQLFEMVYYGHGFSWTEVYNMPVWLRKFYYKKIEEAILQQKKQAEAKQPKKGNRIAKPSIVSRKK